MARNVNGLYTDLLYNLREAPKEDTRNGRVRSVPYPFSCHVENPMERVLFHPVRKANPYFHLMEAVWMLAGSKDGRWLEQFNAGIMNYAEPDGTINGAYGHRWRDHFHQDQIVNVVKEMQANPSSRQAVIAMYDPAVDYRNEWKDRPCNTHIYFRVVGGKLDMTVCNRSNDAVWGLAGANIVHMTVLQELIASAVRMPIGRYWVVTNNLHIYEQHWPLLQSPTQFDFYEKSGGGVITVKPLPMLTPKEEWYELLYECEQFVKNDGGYPCRNNWLKNTVTPMFEHYQCRRNGDKTTYDTNEVEATDWRLAAALWRDWNDN